MVTQMTRSRVLLVEDEADVRDLMMLHLKREGFEAAAVEDGEMALKLLQNEEFQLVILDWMLPGVSGLEICKWIHSSNLQLPVLMVTARADTSDIVRGLEAGADDYVTKPFDIPVFLARVRSLLRRTQSSNKRSEAIHQVGALKLNSETYEVTCGGQPVTLTPSEFKLLLALMKNRGRVLSREKLIELVQGEGVSVVDRAVDTHIFGLRKKLGDCADFVETIRGVGYRVKGDEII